MMVVSAVSFDCTAPGRRSRQVLFRDLPQSDRQGVANSGIAKFRVEVLEAYDCFALDISIADLRQILGGFEGKVLVVKPGLACTGPNLGILLYGSRVIIVLSFIANSQYSGFFSPNQFFYCTFMHIVANGSSNTVRLALSVFAYVDQTLRSILYTIPQPMTVEKCPTFYA